MHFCSTNYSIFKFLGHIIAYAGFINEKERRPRTLQGEERKEHLRQREITEKVQGRRDRGGLDQSEDTSSERNREGEKESAGPGPRQFLARTSRGMNRGRGKKGTLRRHITEALVTA